MIAQFNAWFQKTATNLVFSEVKKGWNDLYGQAEAVDHSKYLAQVEIFDLMSNNQNTVFLLFDVREFKILYCTKNFERITGYPLANLMERNVLFFFEILKKKDIIFYFHYLKWTKFVLKKVPVKFLKEYFQIQWSGMTVIAKDGKEIESLFKVNPFEVTDAGLTRLCVITIEVVTAFMKKDAEYWARMEAGTSERFVSSYFEENTKFVMKDILSDREIEIIRLLADGLDTKEIAEKLFLSPHTVDKHRKNMIARLGVRDSMALLEICRMCNMI
jgi:DNA-binding CsgD family transcriptional regulator